MSPNNSTGSFTNASVENKPLNPWECHSVEKVIKHKIIIHVCASACPCACMCMYVHGVKMSILSID